MKVVPAIHTHIVLVSSHSVCALDTGPMHMCRRHCTMYSGVSANSPAAAEPGSTQVSGCAMLYTSNCIKAEKQSQAGRNSPCVGTDQTAPSARSGKCNVTQVYCCWARAIQEGNRCKSMQSCCYTPGTDKKSTLILYTHHVHAGIINTCQADSATHLKYDAGIKLVSSLPIVDMGLGIVNRSPQLGACQHPLVLVAVLAMRTTCIMHPQSIVTTQSIQTCTVDGRQQLHLTIVDDW